jgi:transglutaminase-like putative cysteine protease
MKLKDEFSPFLRPSQYVNYTADSRCVAEAAELAQGTKSDIEAAEQIFLYVVDNVTYDYDKASTVQSGYLPDVDETLETGKGICFDFASLTTAMLRSQGIPCKLIIGYAGSAYHSWIAIYSRETGKFAAIIEFVEDKYNLADPTFTAAGDDADPNVVGEGDKYQPIYYY